MIYRRFLETALYGSAISLACIYAHAGHPIKALLAAFFVTYVRVVWPKKGPQ